MNPTLHEPMNSPQDAALIQQAREIAWNDMRRANRLAQYDRRVTAQAEAMKASGTSAEEADAWLAVQKSVAEQMAGECDICGLLVIGEETCLRCGGDRANWFRGGLND